MTISGLGLISQCAVVGNSTSRSIMGHGIVSSIGIICDITMSSQGGTTTMLFYKEQTILLLISS